MAYAFVRELTGQAGSLGPNTAIATVPAAGCAQGNLVALGISTDATAAPALTDSGSNTWNLVGAAAINSGTRVSHTYLYYSILTNALTNGNTITATWSGGTTDAAIVATEFSGVTASTAVDQTDIGVGNGGTSLASNSVTTTAANEILIGVLAGRGPAIVSSATMTQGTNWTVGTSVHSGVGAPGHGIVLALEYQIVSATGSYSATGTCSATVDWGTVIGTFSDPAPAGGSTLIYSHVADQNQIISSTP